MLPSAVPQYVIDDLIKTAESTPPGCIVEIGVWKGGTAWYLNELAKKQGRELFLYDTFEGIPYSSEKDYHQVGDFKDTDYDLVKAALPEATVVKGIFPASAVEMPPIAFLHLDCDQYQSVMDSIAYLKDKMVKGGIIWFDDAPKPEGALPGTFNGADYALRELYGDNWNLSPSGKAYIVT